MHLLLTTLLALMISACGHLSAPKRPQNGFLVKAILSPTVPNNKERIRICIHSFNTEEEIKELLFQLKTSISDLKR